MWMGWVLTLFWGLAAFAGGNVLVLRNGSEIELKDSYKVQDKFVVFENAKGELYKLPVKMVDLGATEKRNREVAKPLAEAPKKQRKPEVANPSLTMKTEQKSNVAITDTNLRSFGEENPTEYVDSVESTPPAEGRYRNKNLEYDSVKALQQKKEESAYYDGQIKRLRASIQSDREYIKKLRSYRYQTYYKYSNAQYYENKIKEVEKRIKRTEKEILNVKNRARKRGIKNRVH